MSGCLKKEIIEILKSEVVPAMGCTEPVAVALACAKARETVGCSEIDSVEVLVSPNIYKNGLGVGVPNTDEIGLNIAVALGVVGCSSGKSLKLLEDVTEAHVSRAHELINSDKVTVAIKDTEDKVYIEAKISAGIHSSRVIIRNKHNNIVLVERDNEIVMREQQDNETGKECMIELYGARIRDIVQAVESIDYRDISFLMEGIDMNEGIAKEALDRKLGMGVGYGVKESISKGMLTDDLINNCMMLTAAGADARMSGLSRNVMSSNGSGNNGLTAILPIAVYRRRFNVSDENTAKALAISHIINCYIKKHIGRLSALCGCGVAAATGASAAIAWLMGGDYDQIDGAIKNMIANLSGMICDGAKGSCALKLSTAASAAVQSALLAINNSITVPGTGIIAATAEESIRNLGILSSKGMNITDKVILDIMRQRA